MIGMWRATPDFWIEAFVLSLLREHFGCHKVNWSLVPNHIHQFRNLAQLWIAEMVNFSCRQMIKVAVLSKYKLWEWNEWIIERQYLCFSVKSSMNQSSGFVVSGCASSFISWSSASISLIGNGQRLSWVKSLRCLAISLSSSPWSRVVRENGVSDSKMVVIKNWSNKAKKPQMPNRYPKLDLVIRQSN